MRGFKVFKSIIPKPNSKTEVSTSDHPVQSFVWDDFNAQPDTIYDYEFHPFRGTPANLDRTAAPIPIRIRTEPLFSTQEHDVFFNRGVASSQAYARKFGNKRPDRQPTIKKQEEALQWLTRELDDAALKFIEGAKSGDQLLCCFYEFRYRPVADELKNAIDRGVDVRIIVDAKVNEFTDKDGVFHKSFPREENLQMIADAKIPMAKVTLREAKPKNIAHNKFMILLIGPQRTPKEVWTGSTNISLSGFSGKPTSGTGRATRRWRNSSETTGTYCAVTQAPRRAIAPPTSSTPTPTSAPTSKPSSTSQLKSPTSPRASFPSSPRAREAQCSTTPGERESGPPMLAGAFGLRYREYGRAE